MSSALKSSWHKLSTIMITVNISTFVLLTPYGGVRVTKVLSQMRKQAWRGRLLVQGHTAISIQAGLKFRALFPLRDVVFRTNINTNSQYRAQRWLKISISSLKKKHLQHFCMGNWAERNKFVTTAVFSYEIHNFSPKGSSN